MIVAAFPIAANLALSTPACAVPYVDAHIVQAVVPAYPDSARQLGLGHVDVVVEVTLAPTGTLIGERIYSSSGNMVMDQAALQAARQSTYAPKVVNCQRAQGDYLFRVSFDPKNSPSPNPSASPITRVPPPFPPCMSAALSGTQDYDIFVRRRDYNRALEAATKDADAVMKCGRNMPNTALYDGLAANSLSEAADLAFTLGRYGVARELATRANSIYQQMLESGSGSDSSAFVSTRARAEMQANTDLLQRIARQETCLGPSSASSALVQAVLSEMPSGSTIHSAVVVQNYAEVIAFGPGGYAVRSFLLKNSGRWKILTSQGGAFDTAVFGKNGVPQDIALRLTSGSCAS